MVNKNTDDEPSGRHPYFFAQVPGEGFVGFLTKKNQEEGERNTIRKPRKYKGWRQLFAWQKTGNIRNLI